MKIHKVHQLASYVSPYWIRTDNPFNSSITCSGIQTYINDATPSVTASLQISESDQLPDADELALRSLCRPVPAPGPANVPRFREFDAGDLHLESAVAAARYELGISNLTPISVFDYKEGEYVSRYYAIVPKDTTGVVDTVRVNSLEVAQLAGTDRVALAIVLGAGCLMRLQSKPARRLMMGKIIYTDGFGVAASCTDGHEPIIKGAILITRRRQ